MYIVVVGSEVPFWAPRVSECVAYLATCDLDHLGGVTVAITEAVVIDIKDISEMTWDEYQDWYPHTDISFDLVRLGPEHADREEYVDRSCFELSLEHSPTMTAGAIWAEARGEAQSLDQVIGAGTDLWDSPEDFEDFIMRRDNE